MSTLATLVVKLTADTGDFADDMSKSSRMVGRFTSNIKGNVQSLGKVALGGVAAFGGLAAGGVMALGKLAAGASTLEGIERAFQGVAEASGESSVEMLKALEAGSAGMVAQRDLMLTYNKASQLVSTTFANQLPEAMQYLGKVSAATGQDMGFMLDSLVTGVGRLSGPILDNLGIQVALSEATARASEMFGVEADELSKTQQQAGMMSVVLEKLKKNTEAMPPVAGSGAAAFAQFGAKLKNFKDRVGMAVLPVFTLLVNAFTYFLDKVMPPVVSFVKTKLAPAFELVAGGVQTFLGYLSNGHDIFLATQAALGRMGFSDLANSLNEPLMRIREFIDIITELVGEAWAWIEQNVELNDILLALGIAIASVIVPAILGIVAAVAPIIATGAALVALIALVRQAWENDWLGIRTIIEAAVAKIVEIVGLVIAWVQENWPMIRSTIVGVIQAAYDFLVPIVTAIAEFIGEKVDWIVAWVRENWPLIQSTIARVMEFIQGLINAALGAIADFWATHGAQIMGVAEQAWTTIQNVIDRIIKVVAGIIEAVMQAIHGDWDAAHAALKRVVNLAWDAIQNVITLALSAIRTLLTIAWDALQNLARVAWNALPKIIKGALDIARTVIAWAWEKIQEGAAIAWELLGDLVKGGLDRLVGFLEGILGKMREAGAAIVEAVKDGIARAWDGLVNWFNDRLSDLGNLLPFSEPKDSRSALSGLGRAGEAIVENILTGFLAASPKLESALASIQVPDVTAGAGAGGGGDRITRIDLTANYPEARGDLLADVNLLRLLYGQSD